MMNERYGFTLIELVIVLAVIAIISAAIIPNFIGTTDKARLKTDIQSARILQNAVDLYDAEQSPPFTKTEGAEVDIDKLKTAGYLSGDIQAAQNAGAKWVFAGGKVKVNISDCSAEVHAIVPKLGEQEKSMVTGVK